MARPEQPTGHDLRPLPGFTTTSPFSQPPKTVTEHDHLPGPSALISDSSASRPQLRHNSSVPVPTGASAAGSGSPTPSANNSNINKPDGYVQSLEKTTIGRSGVFDELPGNRGSDQFYRRHSVDMGMSIASKTSQMSAYSQPGLQRYLPYQYQQQQTQQTQSQQQQQKQQQQQQYQQQQQQQQTYAARQGHHHITSMQHGFAASFSRGNRSEGTSPHPLSFDQGAAELSPATNPNDQTAIAALHGSDERGVKRPADGLLFPGRRTSLASGTIHHQHTPGGSGGNGGKSDPTIDKPYACDQCDLTFTRLHNLKSHALTHSTERPYQCKICNTPFRRQHDLKRHMKLHTGEKPHTCTNCGRSFARLDALNRHMRAENFHACSQAAKRARTTVIQKSDDPRLKSASAAYLEQRRASTTSHPPNAPAGWSHWTHRPSIAADEAMLRRVHERFGGPPSYIQQQSAQPRSQSQQQPPGVQYQQSQQQSCQPYYSNSNNVSSSTNSTMPPGINYASSHKTRTSYLQSTSDGGGGSNALQQQQKPHQGSPAMPSSSAHLSHHQSTSSSSAVVSHDPRANQVPAGNMLPSISNVSQGYIPSVERQKQGILMDHAGRFQQSNENSLGIVNGSTFPPPIRLPPIELGPPRRHSLAVTSHLDRYKSRDVIPPEQAPNDSTATSATSATTITDSALPRPHQYSTTVAEPSMTKATSPNTGEMYLYNHGQQITPQARMRNHGGMPSAPGPRSQHGSALSALSTPLETMHEGPIDDRKPRQEINVKDETGQKQQQRTIVTNAMEGQTQMRRTPGAALLPAYVPDRQDSESRRGSVLSSTEQVPETRRSSIIALTNPQSEADIRAENADLKRRLDEMEYRYLKEIDSLKAKVKELEIEKSLLKSLLIERGASVSSAPSHQDSSERMCSPVGNPQNTN